MSEITSANSVTAAWTQMFLRKWISPCWLASSAEEESWRHFWWWSCCCCSRRAFVVVSEESVVGIESVVDVKSLLSLEEDNNKSELVRNVGVLGGHWRTERTDPAARANCTVQSKMNTRK